MADNLESKLIALTEPGQFKAGEMVLGPADAPATKAALLSALDNTILPCLITYSVGSSSVVLKAGGRRLRACVAASNDLNPPADALGKTLSADEGETLAEIGSIVNALLACDGMLTMKREVEPAAMGQSDAGVGVKTLSELWKIDFNAKPPTQFEIFESALGETFIASIETDGTDLTGSRGDTDTADVLKRDVLPKLVQLEADLTKVKTQRDLPYLMTLNSALPDGALVSLFVAEETRSLVASAPGSLPAVAGAWGRV
ncbi:MAG: hypothetical protein AAF340_04110 [Pseudomonadota bacterium]